MIPYDDLVAALSAWRARQGLPVSTLGGGGSGATAQPGSGPNAMMAQPGSGPYAQPGSGPNRGAPPAAPGSGRTKQPSMPPPMQAQTQDEALEVGDEAMLEEHYENEGDDFAMAFNPNAAPGGDGDDATSIGGAPERPTEADMNRRNDRDDW
jgi:hypothetical protein